MPAGLVGRASATRTVLPKASSATSACRPSGPYDAPDIDTFTPCSGSSPRITREPVGRTLTVRRPAGTRPSLTAKTSAKSPSTRSVTTTETDWAERLRSRTSSVSRLPTRRRRSTSSAVSLPPSRGGIRWMNRDLGRRRREPGQRLRAPAVDQQLPAAQQARVVPEVALRPTRDDVALGLRDAERGPVERRSRADPARSDHPDRHPTSARRGSGELSLHRSSSLAATIHDLSRLPGRQPGKPPAQGLR